MSATEEGVELRRATRDEAERTVRSNGNERAWLAIVAGNARVRRVYERTGWTDEGAFDCPAANASSTVPVPCQQYVKRLERSRSNAAAATLNLRSPAVCARGQVGAGPPPSRPLPVVVGHGWSLHRSG
jgi:hypothetical protein